MKRIFAELIGNTFPHSEKHLNRSISDSFIIIVLRVLVLLLYYSNFNIAQAMNPTPEIYEHIINDLHNAIILQSSIFEDSLLMEIDIDDEIVQVVQSAPRLI